VTGQLEIKSNIDISIAWQREDGNMLSVNLRNFESKTLTEMRDYINKTAAKINNCDVYVPMYLVSFHNMLRELRRGRLLKTIRALWGAAFGKSKTKRPSRKAMAAYKKIPAHDKITEDDLVPGTITISNTGSVYKGRGFMGILEIIPPQVFAIGIGGIQEKPGVVHDENGGQTIAVRKIIPMCLAFDHRALNFAEIVPFMQKLDQIFAHPEVLRDWL
jgi:pyruvate dehydrogenase E2 component (dihydrolipoamide acetyltransferase)